VVGQHPVDDPPPPRAVGQLEDLADLRLTHGIAGAAEAPSSSGGVLPLANFGNVGFSGATANGALLTGATPHIDAITMQSGSTVKAQPGSISNGSFSVAWKHS
jgi:hypothetical protein